tara:strand:+ start:1084 stop:2091 length:1008 start_codon:yes stop_codon:yes gene_type:complete
MVEIDRSITWLENRRIRYISVTLPTSLDKKDLIKIQTKHNYLDKTTNTLVVNLTVGLNSSYLNTQILNSSFYLEDKFDNINRPFNDDKDYEGKNITVNSNPKKISKSLGLDNPDPLFEIIDNLPFEDAEKLEDPVEFLNMSSKIKYPKYYNAYSLSKLNSNISIFGTIEEIEGSHTTETSLKGMTVIFDKNGTDSRNRSINITDHTTLRELSIDENGNFSRNIESYSDEEYEDVITGNDDLLKLSFNYSTKIINGVAYTIVERTNDVANLSSVLSNKVIFYTEDNNNIAPFDDNFSNQSENQERSDDVIYGSGGRDSDNSEGTNQTSISYTGEAN